jgi:SAM-dependent methyltransferase
VIELRRTFDGVADLYDRVRPSYPDALFDELFSRLPVSPDIVEVGPGTGQATTSLLNRGARVTAVELGVNMAERLRRKFENQQRLKIIVSSFEDVHIASHEFDAAVSATAYHWIAESVRLEKPIDLLRPGGWLAIIDTVNVSAPSDGGFFQRSQVIYDKYGDGEGAPKLPLAHEATGFMFDALTSSLLYGAIQRFLYPWDQTYDAETFGDVLRSYSRNQAMPEAKREEFIGDIVGLVNEEFGGRVTQPIVIVLTMAQPVGPSF